MSLQQTYHGYAKLTNMDAAKIRAWWAHKQGLDGSLQGKSAAEVLQHTGWARSVGGAGPYLTLFSRAGISREQADAAVAKLEIHELPSARGCTYVLSDVDFALGLKVGQGFSDQAEMNTARKLGVTDAEIDTLRNKVVSVLGKAPLSTEEIRDGVGAAARSLGEEGKKKGLTTTLPIALGLLQSSGDIRRISTNGRLDQQRYKYALWRPNPLAACKLSREEAFIELGRRFYSWIGPATRAEFQWFSGLGAKAAKAALEPLGLVGIEKEDERLMLPADRDALSTFKTPKSPQYALVSSLDGVSQLRRDVRGLLTEEDAKREFFVEKSYQAAGNLTDLPSHAILDRGRLTGLWEFDVDSGTILYITFGKKDKALVDAVKKTEVFVRDQMGDARSFILDTPKSRAPKLEAFRKAAG